MLNTELRKSCTNSFTSLMANPPFFRGKIQQLIKICLCNDPIISPDFFLLQDYSPFLQSHVVLDGVTKTVRASEQKVFSRVLLTPNREKENEVIGNILAGKYV